MSKETLDELCVAWKKSMRPPQPGAFDALIQLHIPTMPAITGCVQYNYAQARYELIFMREQSVLKQRLDLYTTPSMARLIRKYVRHRLGIRFLPSVHVIGRERKSTLPTSLQPQLVKGLVRG